MTAYSFSQLIDFTRTSSGTFVGSNGLIQTTPQSRNLLTFTQEFDNAVWSKTGATIAANSTTAPDGTSTADKIAEDTSTGVHRVAFTLSATAGVFSVYAKAAERPFLLLATGVANEAAWFDLVTGSLGTVQSAATATITAVGNGWYRCTVVSTGATNIQMYAATANGVSTYAGTLNSGIFLWGAQLEQASTASDYTRNVGGLFPARFDYDPVTLAPRGILIEEQRTNLLLRSADATVLPWGFDASTGSGITLTGGLAPDGVTQFAVFNEGTSTSAHRVNQGVTTVAGTTYTVSTYIKAGTSRYVLVGTSRGGFAIDTTTWTITQTIAPPNTTTTNATLTPVGGGVYRASVSVAHTTDTTTFFIVSTSDSGIPGTMTPTFAGTSRTAVFTFCQLEAGAFATSYIPTVASQVTRTADQASIVAPMFAPWFNDSAGTFVVEADVIAPLVGDKRIVGANNATATFAYVTSSTGLYGAFDGTVVNTANAVSANTTFKGATAYDATNKNAVLNGGTVVTAARSASVPLTPGSSIQLGSDRSAFSFLNGHIRRITYYPVRLSDLQLQALTA